MDFQTFVVIIASINGFVMLFIMLIGIYREITEKAECFDCKKPLKKYPYYHKFDAKHGGKYKDGKTCKVCTKCLMKNLKEYFINFKHKAVIIEPFKPFNAYDFCTIGDVERIWKNDGKMESIKKIFQFDMSCIKCGKKTSLMLFSPEVYNKNPYEFKINNSCKGKPYCSSCICKHIEEIIIRERLYFDHVYPPREEDGIMSPFEA
ncbi:MAG: hypothetical protein KAU07_01250 [Candidatus Andersenbacteria bacterium]|nr:hypothetical protein [Candidatus Andersenbacteria bacterium]